MHEFECSGLTWATPPTHQHPNTQPTPIYRCWLHAKFIEFRKWIYEERSRFALALSGVGRKFKRCQKQTRVYTLRPCKFCVSIRDVFPSIPTLQTLNVCQWWRSQTVPAASLIDSRFMRPCCGQSNIDWVRKGHSSFDLLLRMHTQQTYEYNITQLDYSFKEWLRKGKFTYWIVRVLINAGFCTLNINVWVFRWKWTDFMMIFILMPKLNIHGYDAFNIHKCRCKDSRALKC